MIALPLATMRSSNAAFSADRCSAPHPCTTTVLPARARPLVAPFNSTRAAGDHAIARLGSLRAKREIVFAAEKRALASGRRCRWLGFFVSSVARR